MKLDFLFHRTGAEGSRRNRRDPLLDAPIDDMRVDPAPLNAVDDAEDRPKLALPRPPFGVRKMSPRQLAAWAHEMYLSGALDWQEYRFAGFHAELHPDYNRTVGVLTGHRAAPDHPRDMIREWEERLAFFSRHNAPHDPQVRRIEKVLALLSEQAGRLSAL